MWRPAVDPSVIGLLLGTRYLAINGATADQLRPARRLLIFSSLVTLALNVADPLVAGQLGKAAFDAVGPLLLIGWAEVGPPLLAALARARRSDPIRDTINRLKSVSARTTNTRLVGRPVRLTLTSNVLPRVHLTKIY